MTLEEATGILNSIDIIDLKETHDVTDETYNEAIDTVLKALEDSIPKEKVREKIQEYVNRRNELADGHFWENGSNINEDTALIIAIETLRHLGE